MKDGSLSFSFMLWKVSSYKQSLVQLFCTMMLFALCNLAEANAQVANPEHSDTLLKEKPLRVGLRTNALYDLALIPNIGIDYCIDDKWSVSALWTYAWWSKDSSHRYWRTYGGDIALRRWLGNRKDRLTGHHLGIYAQIYTFDVEFGGKGYMAGKPGGSLWEKLSWASGIEYGYSMPAGKRLNIDFTIGVGYTDCTYHEYQPDGNCYLHTSSRHLRTVLPTKARCRWCGSWVTKGKEATDEMALTSHGCCRTDSVLVV